jgi:hypothetical protein
VVTQDEVQRILKSNFSIQDNANHVAGWRLDPDGRVEAYGDVQLKKPQKSLPLRFSKVHGHFECVDPELRTLEGCPEVVTGDFGVENCRLLDLQGAPREVGGYVNASSNRLTSLEGFPATVGGSVFLGDNMLTSLQGLPATLSDDLEIHRNNLSSLEGLPSSITGWLTLDYTPTMPLLRTLSALHVNLIVLEGDRDLKRTISKIINDPKWIGQGKRGAIRCQKALIAAGFEGNARW